MRSVAGHQLWRWPDALGNPPSSCLAEFFCLACDMILFTMLTCDCIRHSRYPSTDSFFKRPKTVERFQLSASQSLRLRQSCCSLRMRESPRPSSPVARRRKGAPKVFGCLMPLTCLHGVQVFEVRGSQAIPQHVRSQQEVTEDVRKLVSVGSRVSFSGQ